jgi:high-affinity Fe2+/Pb2+ permease
MSKVLRAIWVNMYGLLVDDGSMAVGALAAVAITWLFVVAATQVAEQIGGALLLVLVSVLVLTNLYVAGRNARRHRAVQANTRLEG